MAMTSFLDKLRGEKIEEAKKMDSPVSQKPEEKMPLGAIQLDVDIYQTPTEIFVYAPVGGSDIGDLDISIEGDNDVVTIQGTKKRPEEKRYKEENGVKIEIKNEEPIGVQGAKERWLREECKWGVFYRQIVLPQEILISETEAKLEKGVLILRLPLVAPKTGDKFKIVIKKST